MRKVEVVPHNLQWKSNFDTESQYITNALGENAIAIHHIGSTAIATIYAKPIIDFLVEVKSINQVDDRNLEMESIGYEVMGEFGIKDRRFFRKDNQLGIRTHHIHIFEINSAQITRHLAFRDYMLAHPEAAQEYSNLKRKLAAEYPNDIAGYQAGKAEFIKEIDRADGFGS
ncbi:GrpB family protein [Chamaesiphon sp. VAR_48_metabat_403]|uniref:GrpB family protein n=1 Tax=Chamaesiphon sp. VAR_48_metabat_403 TaxID=2964700 RepID=UPI00286E03E4|nr:GrpB family protein [Chamaesiphon sp. VAR_48_metabat_403]